MIVYKFNKACTSDITVKNNSVYFPFFIFICTCTEPTAFRIMIRRVHVITFSSLNNCNECTLTQKFLLYTVTMYVQLNQ